LVFAAQQANAATTTYSSRSNFVAALGTSITDDYETGYAQFETDATMSAVLGETQYHATGFTDNDIVDTNGSNHYYCAGCNGSFTLDFTATSVGTAAGVFGAGVDILENAKSDFLYTAFVTFGDNSTHDFGTGVHTVMREIALDAVTAFLP
jgi:hypothetical protein